MMNGDQFASAAVSDRGLNESRPQNEDSYLELKQYGVFVVADGVGGAQAGEVASQMAVEIIGEAFINISAMLGVAPLTGIPLTFISQGGTAMLIALASAGILLNISRHQKR